MVIGSALARLRRRGAASCPAPDREPGGVACRCRALVISMASLLVLVGLTAPGLASPASAASATKVVIIVGPVGDSQTASYISDANAAAAIARKYTSNVITIYSPKATWAAVSSAVNGANVVLYLGHGNGFPSPYSSTLNTNSMDGFGLNKTANAGNYNWAYYGEYYIRQLHLAPNAVVLFSRLCYASGNSEWGAGQPSLSVAKQRVDNYAAPFIVAGAKAVIADGLGDAGWYVGALFTRHSTIDSLFKAAPDRHNNYATWASGRSAGYTSSEDIGGFSYVPDGQTYYRSMVSIPSLSTDSVVGAAAVATTGAALTGATRVSVNLRSAASVSSSIVRVLPAGAAYSVRAAIVADSTGRTWAPVSVSGVNGYLATEFGTFTGTVIATGPLNMHSSASTGAAVVAVIPAGAAASVRSSSTDTAHRTWFSVTWNGKSGWVASWYTAPSGAVLAVAPTPTPTPVASAALGGKTTATVNFRSAPSSSSSVLKVLGAGATYKVRAGLVNDSSGRTWAPVTLSSGGSGYLAAEFGTFAGSAVVRAPLNMRSSASTSASVVSVLAAGTHLTVRSASTNAAHQTWFAVTLSSGRTGWVAAWYIAP